MCQKSETLRFYVPVILPLFSWTKRLYPFHTKPSGMNRSVDLQLCCGYLSVPRKENEYWQACLFELRFNTAVSKHSDMLQQCLNVMVETDMVL